MKEQPPGRLVDMGGRQFVQNWKKEAIRG